MIKVWVYQGARALVVGSLIMLILVPWPGKAEQVNETRYLGTDEIQVLQGGGYSMTFHNLTSFSTFGFLNKNYTHGYQGNIQVGARVWESTIAYEYAFVEQNQELTGGSVDVITEKAFTFEGWASGGVDITGLNVSRLSGFTVIFYARYRTSATLWSVWGAMVYGVGESYIESENLGMDEILTCTWNFTLYLKCFRLTSPITKRCVYIYFGNSTYDSRVSGIQVDNGLATETEYENYLMDGLVGGGILTGIVCLALFLVWGKDH